MNMNELGRTGLKVTDICLGTMTWGLQNTEAEGHEQMDYAVDAGINFFDTAEMYAVPPSAETYGKTETIIGTWFAQRKNRDKIVLASKVFGPGFGYVRGGTKLNAAQIMEAIENSLKRLQTDYIDLYQLHWPARPYPHHGRHGAGKIVFTAIDTAQQHDEMLEILRTLDTAMKAGKIRHAGLSNDSAWGIMKYLALAEQYDLPRMQSVQNEFSILYRHDDPNIAEVCVRENVAYLPYSPLAAGMISGKYLDNARPKGSRWSIDSRKPHRDTPTGQDAVRAYMDVAKKHGLDVCQMAIAFCRQQNFITSTIIGATSMDQLKNDIAAGDLTLSDAVLADIETVYRRYPQPY